MIKNSGNFSGAGLKALEARIREMGKKKVVVGVPAATNGVRKDGLSNATIAAAHEFGVPGHIPERSFLRTTLGENKKDATRMLVRELKVDISRGDFSGGAFATVGQMLEGAVKRKIIGGLTPGLSEATKAMRIKKASYLSKKQRQERVGRASTPLYDTGNLLQSITYEVREK